MFRVGQRVRMRLSVVEHPSGDCPGGVCAKTGETVVVRRVGGGTFPISVQHESRTDGATFGVSPFEIEPLE